MTPQRSRPGLGPIAVLVAAFSGTALAPSARGQDATPEAFPFDRERPAAGRFIGEAGPDGEPPQPVEVRLVPPGAAGGAWTGEITRVAAAVLHAPLEEVACDGRSVSFVAPAAASGQPTRFSGAVSEDGQTLAGRFEKGGKEFEASLGRLPLVPELASVEHYRGAIDLPGLALGLFVSIGRTPAGRAIGRLDIPLQSAFDLTLTNVTAGDRELSFSIPGPRSPTGPAVLRGERSEDGKQVKGSLKQGSMAMPFALERVESRPSFARPQTPAPPYPYASTDVTYACPDPAQKGATLAGTLTVPRGQGPFPAAILVTGSGPQDRDETLFGHKPFLVLADHLTRAGVAVLRVDDRNVGRSKGFTGTATSADLAGDVLAGLAFLAARPEVDPERVGLIGHSEGGLIAPLVATRAPEDVAFVVLLAGPGVPGGEILALQAGDVFRDLGVAEEDVTRILGLRRALFALMTSGAEDEVLRAKIDELFEVELAATPAAKRPPVPPATLKAQYAVQLLDPWVRFFVTHDPRPVLAKVRCPVLAVNGTLDTQVPWELNLPEIARALAEGKNHDFAVRAFPGLNHLFQPAVTGKVPEYAEIEETFAPAALRAVSTWIVERAGGERRRE